MCNWPRLWAFRGGVLFYWREKGCSLPSCGPYAAESIEEWARNNLHRSKFSTSEPMEELKREALAHESRRESLMA